MKVCASLRQKVGNINKSKLNKDRSTDVIDFIFKFSYFALYCSDSLQLAMEAEKEYDDVMGSTKDMEFLKSNS